MHIPASTAVADEVKIVVKDEDPSGKNVNAANTENNPSTSASTTSKKPRNKAPKFSKITKKDIKLIHDLGAGSYGVVSLVNIHGDVFALKQINKSKVLQVEKVANVHFERDVL